MNMQTQDVLFGRSVFGGFNRRDVIEYIDKLQQTAARSASDSAKAGEPTCQLESACAERDALREEVRALREEITQLRAQLKVEQAASALREASRRNTPEEGFSAEAESVRADDPKELSMRDVDEMVKKYFG
ncbi:MAG: hypothetical protein IJT44_08745 [Clostridia bacterium]|nr:hypothetical protein [Clostridia bacterium]